MEEAHSYKRALKYLERKTTPETLEKIKSITLSSENDSIIKRKISELSKNNNLNIVNAAIDDLIKGKKSAQSNFSFEDLKNTIRVTPLYLPTYRRIEDDILESDLDERIKSTLKKQNMHFSLNDIEERLSEIKKELLASAKNSTSKINAEILSKLVNQIKIEEIDSDIILNNNEKIESVLARIGNEIPKSDKEKIIQLVHSKEIFRNKDYTFLLYFLSKMYEAFFAQESNDKALRDFSKICSNYLKNSKKEMIYDDKALDINIISTENIIPIETEKTIKFNQLSSGEKQIISLFSKLYLENNNNYAILFDEPELSLSIEWQKKLLHDIINSGKCKLLIAMTHSPFIFKGLSQYTTDLRKHFS